MLLPRFGSLLRQTKGSTGAGFEPATWGLCALRFKLVDKLAHDEDSVVTAEAEAWHTSGWLPPNGEDRGPFCGSSLQLSRFLGVRNGAMMVFVDPSGCAPLVGDLGSRRRNGGERLCPRWGSTSRRNGRKTSPSPPPKERHSRTPRCLA
jgi:hypothetical protein